MNDFTEIENELKKLRPAEPSPILFERVEQALNRTAPVSDASPSRWRFAGFRNASAREAKTRHNWFSLGIGLAAAAGLASLALLRMEREQPNPNEIAQAPRSSESAPLLNGTDQVGTDKFVPAGATRLVYNRRDEGLQFARGSGQPLRRVRYQTHETWQWRNPTTGESLRVSYPSEEVVLIPVSGE